ncbi:hypothetical protein Slin15195_G067650 [Septoria linicola]|uniref:Uncharacterized protein n=1 Tax=Septoria linicola TaxID=215465 RepID=A0A9Q9EJ52_9PEZI|nr:hypothetical protein Slin15195_G067650 [Septoria linicola]
MAVPPDLRVVPCDSHHPELRGTKSYNPATWSTYSGTPHSYEDVLRDIGKHYMLNSKLSPITLHLPGRCDDLVSAADLTPGGRHHRLEENNVHFHVHGDQRLDTSPEQRHKYREEDPQIIHGRLYGTSRMREYSETRVAEGLRRARGFEDSPARRLHMQPDASSSSARVERQEVPGLIDQSVARRTFPPLKTPSSDSDCDDETLSDAPEYLRSMVHPTGNIDDGYYIRIGVEHRGVGELSEFRNEDSVRCQYIVTAEVGSGAAVRFMSVPAWVVNDVLIASYTNGQELVDLATASAEQVEDILAGLMRTSALTEYLHGLAISLGTRKWRCAFRPLQDHNILESGGIACVIDFVNETDLGALDMPIDVQQEADMSEYYESIIDGISQEQDGRNMGTIGTLLREHSCRLDLWVLPQSCGHTMYHWDPQSGLHIGDFLSGDEWPRTKTLFIEAHIRRVD